MREPQYRPPHPWPGSAKPPDIVDLQTFTDVHRWADIKMGNYIARPRSNHAVVPYPATLYSLCPDNAFELLANNAEARIALAEITMAHLRAHDDLHFGPACFVTISPAGCAKPVGDGRPMTRETNAVYRHIGPAAQFDVVRLQQIAREAMGATPFIGMVEMALFYRWGPCGRSRHDWISWHCHLLTWGATQQELSRYLSPLRERHRSMRDGVPSVHVQAVPEDDLERQFLYALKAPQKLYRVEHFTKPWRNPKTREVRPPGWHLQKDWLRTSHRLRCADIMGPRTLDKMLFGGGTGTILVRAIREEALAPFRAWERRQPYAQRAGV